MSISIPNRVEIIDVTLRDGFQNEEFFIPTESKLWIANKLIEAGFKRLEIGSFSHIKYVPQFKDIEQVLSKLPNREDMEYTVLALNSRGCERVEKAINNGCKIDRVLCGQLATSDAYAKKNMNRTHDELFEEAQRNVKFLHSIGIKKVVANIGTIFGCPLQGEIQIEKAYEFVDKAFEIGFDEIEHSDTDGIAAPNVVYEYFSKILSRHPDASAHSFHIHDIRGMGLASYFAAMQAGIKIFDTSLGGTGGQVANIVDGIPVTGSGEYYYNNIRTGLVETCDFISMLEKMSVETGIDAKKCVGVLIMLERILDRNLSSFTRAL